MKQRLPVPQDGRSPSAAPRLPERPIPSHRMVAGCRRRQARQSDEAANAERNQDLISDPRSARPSSPRNSPTVLASGACSSPWRSISGLPHRPRPPLPGLSVNALRPVEWQLQIVARLFPRSQRHGRAVAILTQSRRRAHDACIHHCDRDRLWIGSHLGGPGAARGLKRMPQAISPFSVEERTLDGGTTWVAVRARGAEWSWSPAEAAYLGQQWVERYGPRHSRPTTTQDEHALIAAD